MEPSNKDIVLDAAARLIRSKDASDKLRSLPVASGRKLSGHWSWMRLPDWAADLVPSGLEGFYVPEQNGVYTWQEYDWWLGAATMLTSVAEKAQEVQRGPIHSYSFRLDPALHPSIQHAWVNRIVMFLRRWWANDNGADEKRALGSIPPAVIYLTHDVDAVSKTLAIRTKQAAFNAYNKRLGSALKFMFGPANYWQFETITELEDRYDRRSIWNFYGAGGGLWRTPKEHLFDPSYDVRSRRIINKLVELREQGHQIGLHPRFDTWRDINSMQSEKQAIEEATRHEIVDVRQHWLRFSFAETWKAQKAVGLTNDYTLGFNDRPGFRNGAALSFVDASSGMRVTPMVLMDSHLFDYANMGVDDRFRQIDRLLDELVFTGGEASIIWHQRVFHADYGWGAAYEYLLDGMKTRGIASPER